MIDRVPEPNPLVETVPDADLRLWGELSRKLLKYVAARRREPVAFMVDILETIFRDNLIDAVLDERRGSGSPTRL